MVFSNCFFLLLKVVGCKKCTRTVLQSTQARFYYVGGGGGVIRRELLGNSASAAGHVHALIILYNTHAKRE